MAYFTFTDASNETFAVRIDDAAQIAHARALVAGTTESDGLIGGTIVKAPAAYNIGWSYRLDAKSVFFFDFSIEVGDSTMRYIETHLSEIGGHLLPGRVWSGWTSKLTGELTVREGGRSDDRLRGTTGDDLLLGREGQDLLVGRDGDDHLSGGRGTDVLKGGGGNDKLGGDEGGDMLYGGDGNDVLVGGAGDDRMMGGAGRDVFMLDRPDATGRELIVDFEGGPGRGDRMRVDSTWLQAVGDLDFNGRIDRVDLALAFQAEGENLVLSLGEGREVVLFGGAARGLDAGDFVIG